MDKISLINIKLKNGLQYIGLGSKEDIQGNEVFISIPAELVITSSKAYFSDI